MRVFRMAGVCLVALLIVMFCGLFAGTTQAGGVGVSPSSYNFGSVTVNSASSPRVIVVTNYSGRPIPLQQVSSNLAQFAVNGPALPLYVQPNQSVSYQVIFTPTSAGTFSGTIQFTFGRHSGNILSVAVSGSGIATAAPTPTYLLAPSASSLSFSSVLVGSSTSQSLTLSNTGSSNVSISQVAASGTGFSVSGAAAVTLSPGQSTALTVQFSPSAAGSFVGSVSVVSNATNSPATIALSGTGIQPMIAVVPSTVNFGSVTVGVTNTQTITVSNPGSANLSVTQVAVSSGFQASASLPITIAPGKSAALTVSYTPATASTTSGLMTIVSNAPNSPLNVSLSGTGVTQTALLSANPASVSFGSVTTGTSGSQSVTIKNTGNSSVSVSQISVTGTGFSYSGIALPVSLAAGQSANFTVSIAPANTGSFTGTATVVSTATNSPLTIALSGTGAAPVTHAVNLSWLASTSTVAGYHVYRGSQTGGPYTLVDPNLQSALSFSDTSVGSSQTYYYVVTDVDTSGLESGYSNEAVAQVP